MKLVVPLLLALCLAGCAEGPDVVSSQASEGAGSASVSGMHAAGGAAAGETVAFAATTASLWSEPGWTRPSDDVLRQRLTELQFNVTRQDDTERSFRNTWWDNKAEGLYVDIISGEPLFSSRDKFKSGTGWPSFTQPVDADRVTSHDDSSLFTSRAEVRSALADSHLGHVFDDGPAPTGLRYCVNSAALGFIPADELQAAGYADYVQLFETPKTN